jgi:tRNA(fMet)-specific endonuclease VapC
VNYLLDTNAVIALLGGREPLLSRVRSHRPQEIVVSAIVTYELFYGAYKSRNQEKNLAKVAALQFESLAMDDEGARHAGDIRATLEKAGMPIGPYDLLIAGQARARSLTLVTRNTREFQRVADLQIEDWQNQL